jgi:Ca-activated chloride channel family protein
LPTTPELDRLTEAEVFARAPRAEWRAATPDDPARAAVELGCGVAPRLADGTVYAAVNLRGRTLQGALPPLNLALVLDRSGSMAGKPFDNMLRAAEAMLTRLRDGDRVSVVVFSDGVFEAVPPVALDPANRAEAIARVRALRHGGGTWISGGMLAGLHHVFSAFDEWQVNQLVLLSDGQPTRGITSSEGLFALAERAAERGVGVTTIGFGHLHDELLMQGIADAGGGSYHYVGAPGDIPPLFEREAAAMLRTAVRATYAVIDLPPGLPLDDVIGYDYLMVGQRLYIRLGSVPMGEDRYAVLRFRPPATGGGTAGGGALALDLTYSDMSRRARLALRCTVALGAAGGQDRWALELAGRAEAAWGYYEAMGWADGGSDVYAISQLQHTRDVLGRMRPPLGGDALAAEDRLLAEAQTRLGIGVASGATSSFLSGGMGGLMSFAGRKAEQTATAAVVDAAFKPLSRGGVSIMFYGQPAVRYSVRGQRPFKLHDAERSNKYKQARFDAYVMMRVRVR